MATESKDMTLLSIVHQTNLSDLSMTILNKFMKNNYSEIGLEHYAQLFIHIHITFIIVLNSKRNAN